MILVYLELVIYDHSTSASARLVVGVLILHQTS
jgi:hypothetical protein